MNTQVTPLFSAPLYTTVIDLSQCPQLDTVEYTYRKTRELVGDNYISTNDYILRTAEWSHIRTQCEDHVDKYFRQVMSAQDNIAIEITNSWVNKYTANQSHQRHYHPNSVISSALFFVDHDSSLEFYHPRPSEVDFDRAEFTPLNSKTWAVKPQAGLLALFPSWLEHRATTVTTDKTRYSLSFDTRITGTLEVDPFRYNE